MVALSFFGIIHVPINVPALGVAVKEDDVNINRELIAHGLSNTLSGCVGSIQVSSKNSHKRCSTHTDTSVELPRLCQQRTFHRKWRRLQAGRIPPGWSYYGCVDSRPRNDWFHSGQRRWNTHFHAGFRTAGGGCMGAVWQTSQAGILDRMSLWGGSLTSSAPLTCTRSLPLCSSWASTISWSES